MRGKHAKRRLPPLPHLLIPIALMGAILWVARPTADPPSPAKRPATGDVAAVGTFDLELASRSNESRAWPGMRGAPPPRRFTLAFTGDILVHRPVWEAAAAYGSTTGRSFDFRPMFRPVRPILSRADLALCHLETPLSFDPDRLSSYPVFNVPAELAGALARAGYDGCSTASNHSLDGGEDGVRATLRALDAAGLGHSGTARSRREAKGLTLYPLAGARVAHLSYAYGFNGFVPDRAWRANLIDPRGIVEDARRARADGSDFTVVSLHWGSEYVSDPTGEQRTLARQLARHPTIDLIVGHHAHVIQPVERLHGTYVAYGLGNFLSNQSETSGVQDGLALLVTVQERGGRFVVEDVRYAPTWVEQGTTWRILPVADALEDGPPAALRDALRASWLRTTAVVESLGTPGLHPLRRAHP